MTVLRTSNAAIGLNRGKPVSTIQDGVTWSIPSDWINFTLPGPAEQKVIGTVAVFNQDSNYLAVNATITDGYTVDWGDGTSTTHASGTTAEKNYTWASISAGTLTSAGYRQAVVTITPTIPGRTFTVLQLSRLHSAITTSTFTSSPWLNIAIAAPNANAIEFNFDSSGTATGRVRNALLENINIVSSGTTIISNMFRNMYALLNVSISNTLPAGNITAQNAFQGCGSLEVAPAMPRPLTGSTANMFQNCSSLQAVPLYDTSAVTSMSSMFNGCSSLQSVPFFNTSLVNTMQSMFNTCRALVEIPPFNCSANTTFDGTFQNCSSLRSFPQITTTSALTTTATMFTACTSLQTLPLFITSGVTSTASMFQNAVSLESVPAFNLTAVTSASGMFSSCQTLQSVPDFGFNSLTNVSSMFSGCTSLRQVPNINLSTISSNGNNNLALGSSSADTAGSSLGLVSISNNKWTQTFQNCNMGATQLDAMYTALVTLNPAITTVSGNGTTVTVTVGTGSISPFVVGRSVTITAVDPIAYNISGTVASVNAGAGTFTITNAATGAYVSGGVASITDNRTITVTGNPGVASDTPAIATAKGWTVVG
jgi:surface protein